MIQAAGTAKVSGIGNGGWVWPMAQSTWGRFGAPIDLPCLSLWGRYYAGSGLPDLVPPAASLNRLFPFSNSWIFLLDLVGMCIPKLAAGGFKTLWCSTLLIQLTDSMASDLRGNNLCFPRLSYDQLIMVMHVIGLLDQQTGPVICKTRIQIFVHRLSSCEKHHLGVAGDSFSQPPGAVWARPKCFFGLVEATCLGPRWIDDRGSSCGWLAQVEKLFRLLYYELFKLDWDACCGRKRFWYLDRSFLKSSCVKRGEDLEHLIMHL